MKPQWDIRQGDALDVLASMEDASVHCVVTSPPYWGLRDYGVAGQMGLEATPAEFMKRMVAVFREVRRVLRKDGTCWVNMGDSYAGSGKGGNPEGGKQSTNKGSQTVACLYGTGKSQREVAATNVSRKSLEIGLKPKDMVGIPWRLAFALQDDGWWLRQDIVWAKPNGMPGSQQDRCTSSHEYVFMLTKSATYYSDFDAIKTPPRESTLIRLAQDVQLQAGSHRANGGAKANGTMKAVPGGQENIRKARDKQRGHSRTHAGFNDRWDAMEKDEQQSRPAMMRDVWFIPPAQFAEAHFAVMPQELARRCIAAGCPEGGVVMDTFSGSGTTGIVALRQGCEFIGIELNPEYAAMSRSRLEAFTAQKVLDFT